MDTTKNFEYDVEFFDREKEKEEILFFVFFSQFFKYFKVPWSL